MKRGRLILLLLVAALVVAFLFFDLGRYFNLEFFETQRDRIDTYYQANPGLTSLAYVLVYILVTALSLPGAAVMTLAGGAIFGLVWGTVLVSFASTIGATLAFLVSRFLFRDLVQSRFGDNLRTFNAGIERDGAFYLFFLRLVPVFPFFVINLVMGLTPMRALKFFFVSQLGMFPGTIVFINAGTELAQIDATTGVLTPGLIGSFVLLGLFPFIARRCMEYIKARRVLRPYPKPARFDQNLVVIGAGSAGLVTSLIAGAVKAKVTLIERDRMGGDCLNTGCVPSKALIRTARFVAQARRAHELGVKSAEVDFDFAEIMDRIQNVVKQIEPHDSPERYASLGVECIKGEATIKSPYTVEVNGQTITTRNIVIATGARPFVPPIPGIEKIGYLTSDTVWDLRKLPDRLVVLGGGAIGSELAQCFARLGARVTQIEMLPRILFREDPEISAMVHARLEADGVDLRVDHKATEFRIDDSRKLLLCEHQGEAVEIEFDEVLVAVGRVANLTGYGLEELNIPAERTVEVNEYLQTSFPNIYACGDVAGPYQFTHVSGHQGWYASVNALFGSLKKFKVDYRVIPWATFTDPEVARVGLNETEAKEQGIDYEVTTYGIDDLDRAIADSEAHGLVKVLTVPGKDRILGATIVGEHAGELIIEYIAAMRHGFGMNKILSTIHIYPTYAEANKYAAGEWKKAHAPLRLLKWIERYHRWLRG